jgi:hypothetical protein
MRANNAVARWSNQKKIEKLNKKNAKLERKLEKINNTGNNGQ